MRFDRTDRSRRGAVLILVVGVLALLSLIAATFGMVMRTEHNAARNQTDYEMARQAAHAGYEYLLQSLRDIGTPALRASGPPLVCPEPGNSFYSRELFRRDGVRVGFMTAEPEPTLPVHAALDRKAWAMGLGSRSSGLFDLNRMGHAGDLGDEPHDGQRYTSFDLSLARLLKARFDELAAAGTLPGADDDIFDFFAGFGNDAERQRIAAYLSAAILAHRYGENGVPGSPGNADHWPSHQPAFVYWPGRWAAADTGAPLGGDYWGRVDSGSPDDGVYQRVVYSGSASSGAVDKLIVAANTWIPGEHAGRVVSIVSGSGAGESAMILANSDDTLFVFPDWITIPDGTSQFVIQPLQNAWFWQPAAADWDEWNATNVTLLPLPSPDAIATFMPLFDSANTNKNAWRTTFATGGASNGSTAYALNLTGNWPDLAPGDGDAFAINRTGTVVIGSGDGSPTALLWPNDVLSCETFVFPRAVDKGVVIEVNSTGDVIRIDKNWTESPVRGFSLRIVDGNGRGQVRDIVSVSSDPEGDALTLNTAFSRPLQPARVLATGTIDSHTADTLTVTWGGAIPEANRYEGCAIRCPDVDGDIHGRRIESHVGTDIEIVGSFLADPDDPEDGQTFEIVEQHYVIEYNGFDGYDWAGAVSSTTFTANTLTDSDKNWAVDGTNNAYAGAMVTITASSDPDVVGETRLIRSNTATTLTLDRDWSIIPPGNSRYRIELRNDFKYRPDDLEGDDRVYRSVAEILPVVENALSEDPNVSLSGDDPGKAAALLYNAFKDDLTVSSESGARKSEFAGINDPATDGIDNDENGVVDDENYTPEEYAKYLYDRLGLRDWAHASALDEAARVQQAAQLVANIIDFRDEDSEPVYLEPSDLDEDVSFTPVYGYEGLHVTEVMATPTAIEHSTGLLLTGVDTGTELVHDGNAPVGTYDDIQPPTPPYYLELKDNLGWDWDGGNNCWILREDDKTGRWSFDKARLDYGFKQGWYAIRIHGSPGETYRFTCGGRTGLADTDANGWGYVRLGSGVNSKLLPVEIDVGEVLTFELHHFNSGNRFYGFQLLPQYVELTNCAANDIPLDSITVPSLAGGGVSATFRFARGTRIPGAAADGSYPIEYGMFVVAMSEEAYDRQWGVNDTGIWGDHETESYPVWFVGDESNTKADNLLLDDNSPAITVRSDGRDVAWTGVDALDGEVGTVPQYHAREKNTIPFGTGWVDFDDPTATSTLDGSQGSLLVCLNRNYSLIWDSYPGSIADLSGTSNVWPVILNRPYASPGWLGLVPTGHTAWRTVDPGDPDPDVEPIESEELLGTLMARALVGNVHARLNLNHPVQASREAAFKAAFSDAEADQLAVTIHPADGWANWDALLAQSELQNAFYGNGANDSGACTFADDFTDDSDEKEEWARRFSNVVSLEGTNFKYVVAGLVYDEKASSGDRPIAAVRIEVELDVSGSELSVVNFRYVND